MLAYLFLNLFVGFKKCWKENSSSGWTSCRRVRTVRVTTYYGGGGWGGEMGNWRKAGSVLFLWSPSLALIICWRWLIPPLCFFLKIKWPPPAKKKNLPPLPKATKSDWSLRRVKTANGNRLPEENAKQRQSMKRTTCTKYSSEKPWSPSMCIRSTCLSKSSIGTGWRPCK